MLAASVTKKMAKSTVPRQNREENQEGLAGAGEDRNETGSQAGHEPQGRRGSALSIDGARRGSRPAEHAGAGHFHDERRRRFQPQFSRHFGLERLSRAARSATSNVVTMISVCPSQRARDDSTCSPRPRFTVFRPSDPSSGKVNFSGGWKIVAAEDGVLDAQSLPFLRERDGRAPTASHVAGRGGRSRSAGHRGCRRDRAAPRASTFPKSLPPAGAPRRASQ